MNTMAQKLMVATAVLAYASLSVFAQATQPAAPAGASAKEGIAVTVYNGNFGVVREVRAIDIGPDGQVRFQEVPTAIDPTTVHFASLTDPSAVLLEQNYQYDLVSADKLLQKYIDKEITVVAGAQGGVTTNYAGVLQSFDGEHLVLKTAEGIIMVRRPDNVRDIRFSSLPQGLMTKPTLVWLVNTAKPGKQLAEVTYQTGGLTWHAEYVLLLKGNDSQADLAGWVSVQNNSGKTYTDAKLKFIAGEVQKVQPMMEMLQQKAAVTYDMPVAAQMVEKAFFEYHMYSLPRPSTVADNEVKQLEMFTPAKDIKVSKWYLYKPLRNFRWDIRSRFEDPGYGATSDKDVFVFIDFKNDKASNLGIPLPGGVVRVYKADPADNSTEFVGEERIEHTPKDENLSLRVGTAFDIKGERKQTDFRKVSDRVMRESIQIKLRNHKDEKVVVRVIEPMYRYTNWEMLQSSQEYKKLESHEVAWDVPVDANGETTVTYSVEYSW